MPPVIVTRVVLGSVVALGAGAVGEETSVGGVVLVGVTAETAVDVGVGRDVDVVVGTGVVEGVVVDDVVVLAVGDSVAAGLVVAVALAPRTTIDAVGLATLSIV